MNTTEHNNILTQQIETLRAQVSELTGLAQTLNAENESQYQQILTLQQRIDTQRQELIKTKQALKTAQDDLEWHKMDARKMDKVRADLREQISTLTTQHDTLTAQHKTLSEQNNSLMQSMQEREKQHGILKSLTRSIKEKFSLQ